MNLVSYCFFEKIKGCDIVSIESYFFVLLVLLEKTIQIRLDNVEDLGLKTWAELFISITQNGNDSD
eukprot:SAG31_NODE_13118_length_891_cov_1.351010_1_plen_66_part_00